MVILLVLKVHFAPFSAVYEIIRQIMVIIILHVPKNVYILISYSTIIVSSFDISINFIIQLLFSFSSQMMNLSILSLALCTLMVFFHGTSSHLLPQAALHLVTTGAIPKEYRRQASDDEAMQCVSSLFFRATTRFSFQNASLPAYKRLRMAIAQNSNHKLVQSSKPFASLNVARSFLMLMLTVDCSIQMIVITNLQSTRVAPTRMERSAMNYTRMALILWLLKRPAT